MLDKPSVIKVRLREYAKRTKPVFVIAKKLGYKIHKIDAEGAPYKVLKSILSKMIHSRFLKSHHPRQGKIASLATAMLASSKFVFRKSPPSRSRLS